MQAAQLQQQQQQQAMMLQVAGLVPGLGYGATSFTPEQMQQFMAIQAAQGMPGIYGMDPSAFMADGTRPGPDVGDPVNV